jgi:asparaginyl-tRNA synthetase
MRAWRRCLSTSASVISQQKPRPLRCRQILEKPEASEVTDDAENNGGASVQPEHREIQVQGLVRSVRKQKRFGFAEISDGSTVRSLQAVLTPEQASPYVLSWRLSIDRVFTDKRVWDGIIV